MDYTTSQCLIHTVTLRVSIFIWTIYSFDIFFWSPSVEHYLWHILINIILPINLSSRKKKEKLAAEMFVPIFYVDANLDVSIENSWFTPEPEVQFQFKVVQTRRVSQSLQRQHSNQVSCKALKLKDTEIVGGCVYVSEAMD